MKSERNMVRVVGWEWRATGCRATLYWTTNRPSMGMPVVRHLARSVPLSPDARHWVENVRLRSSLLHRHPWAGNEQDDDHKPVDLAVAIKQTGLVNINWYANWGIEACNKGTIKGNWRRDLLYYSIGSLTRSGAEEGTTKNEEPKMLVKMYRGRKEAPTFSHFFLSVIPSFALSHCEEVGLCIVIPFNGLFCSCTNTKHSNTANRQ